MEEYLKNFKNCLQKEAPYCVSACPFHIDVINFIEKAKRGDLKAAFNLYRNATGFPKIAAEICSRPCEGVCPMERGDGAIALNLIEKACIDAAKDAKPTDYNLPPKKGKIAIIGAGISGLSCALRLSTKKYAVEIFEAKDRIGGQLWDLMDPDIFLKDIENQFAHQEFTLHLNTPVNSAEQLSGKGFDAVYVATGAGGQDFGLLNESEDGSGRPCKTIVGAGWFAGGSLLGEDPTQAMACGLFMGTILDNYLKTGNLLYPSDDRPTRIQIRPERELGEKAVRPANGISFTPEEAAKEANRCIECQCDACRAGCDLTEYYNKWPLRIRDEVMATIIPGSSEIKATPAKRLIHTSDQSGICREVCPENIDLDGLILAARQSMHRQGKTPWVFHDFWLRDMDFSNGPAASLAKAPKGLKGCHHAFFPGCQLGAGAPELVKSAYASLLEIWEDTGLILACCGVPAEWAGDEERHEEVLGRIRKDWEALMKPVMILACPTCEKKFKKYLPEIPVKSLYEVLDEEAGSIFEEGSREDLKNLEDFRDSERLYSVFDACAARNEPLMKEAVRHLAEKAGIRLEPLPENDELARCCSYGGQVSIANPDYAEKVIEKRIQESENPYITYCINCRDLFLAAGKKTLHILELLFGKDTPGDGQAPRRSATVEEGRRNREMLKTSMLKEFWDEDWAWSEEHFDVKLIISRELKEKLNKERILEKDLKDTILFCEKTGRKILNEKNATFSGYRQKDKMTYWVEYRRGKNSKTFELINAYCHRLSIQLEDVWNGVKCNHEK